MLPGLDWVRESGWRYNPPRVVLMVVKKLVAQPKIEKLKTEQDDTL